MQIKRTVLSTRLSDLYGRDKYYLHIELNREYWYYFAGENKISDKYGPGWYKLKVTYIRSGCMFYIFPDFPEIEEQFCAINSFLASSMTLAEIDPIKDLGDTLGDIEAAKLKYCFDTEHTIVKNWPNEREIEIDENEYYQKLDLEQYLYIKMLEKK